MGASFYEERERLSLFLELYPAEASPACPPFMSKILVELPLRPRSFINYAFGSYKGFSFKNTLVSRWNVSLVLNANLSSKGITRGFSLGPLYAPYNESGSLL